MADPNDPTVSDPSDDAEPSLDLVEFADDEVVPIADLVDLYEAVGWLIHAADPDAAARAVDRSTYVVTARSPEGDLVGLARCLSDDVTLMHLVEVLVHPRYRRLGVGTTMVAACLRRFDHVRQTVLLTDDQPGAHRFHRSVGFRPTEELAPIDVRAFIRSRVLGD